MWKGKKFGQVVQLYVESVSVTLGGIQRSFEAVDKRKNSLAGENMSTLSSNKKESLYLEYPSIIFHYSDFNYTKEMEDWEMTFKRHFIVYCM